MRAPVVVFIALMALPAGQAQWQVRADRICGSHDPHITWSEFGDGKGLDFSGLDQFAEWVAEGQPRMAEATKQLRSLTTPSTYRQRYGRWLDLRVRWHAVGDRVLSARHRRDVRMLRGALLAFEEAEGRETTAAHRLGLKVCATMAD